MRTVPTQEFSINKDQETYSDPNDLLQEQSFNIALTCTRNKSLRLKINLPIAYWSLGQLYCYPERFTPGDCSQCKRKLISQLPK